MASSLASRLARIERACSARSAATPPVPDTWESFARLCTIRSHSQLVSFDPFSYQREIAKILAERSIIIAKTRQLGITEALANWALWRAARDPAFLGVFLSKTQADTSAIAKRLRRSIDSLRGLVKLAGDSLLDMQIQGGGRLLFRNSSIHGTRGLESVSFALIDEAAFIAEADLIYQAIAPAVSAGGVGARVAIVSTPNGQSGFFWEMLSSCNGSRCILAECERVRRGSGFAWWNDMSGWGKILCHWRAHPLYSQRADYLEVTQRAFQLSDTVLRQEFDLNFEMAECNIFDAGLVRGAIGGERRSPRSPRPGERCWMGIDPAGDGNDYAVACVVTGDADRLEIVDWYRERRRTSQHYLYRIGMIIERWQPSKIGIEKNSMGQIWAEQLSAGYSRAIEAIVTSAASKPILIDRLLLALERAALSIPADCPLVDELLNYQRRGKVLGAPPGKHDDFVMALAMALAVSPLTERPKKLVFGCLES